MKKRCFIAVLAILSAALLFAGCQIELPQKAMINGGGWIYPPCMTEGKASFGFTVELYDIVSEPEIDFSVRGRLTYVDHANGVRIAGPVTGVLTESPGGFIGTYCNGGTFRFIPSDDDPDEFEIYVTGGEFDGYMNSGVLNGGSIMTKMIYD